MTKPLTRLSGYLLHYGWSSDAAATSLVFPPEFRICSAVNEWGLYYYDSPRALLGEEYVVESSPPYTYEILIKVVSGYVLLLAQSKRIAQDALDVIKKFGVPLFNIKIDTDFLTQIISGYYRSPNKSSDSRGFYSGPSGAARRELESRFALVSVYCVVPASLDQRINNIEFSGSDIGHGELFRANMKSLTSVSCELRRLASSDDLVKVGSLGHISMRVAPSPATLHTLDKVIELLREAQLLSPYFA